MHASPLVGTPTGDPVYVDDFAALVARGVASDGVATPGKWRLERGCYGARRGQLLYSGPGAGAITFDPGVRGAHMIHVGGFAPAGRQLGIYVRVSGEPNFTYLQTERHEPCYEEMLFKTADLTGKTIEVASFDRDACLDYLKLTPANPKPLPAPSKTLIGILDFADDAGVSRPPGFEAGAAVRAHADAGYDMIMWKAYAVRCEYHTKVGEVRLITDAGEAAVKSDGLAASNAGIGHLLSRYDTMRQAVDEAKKIGIKIFGWARINNEFSRKNHQFSPDTPFHLANPDKFQQYRNGRYSCKLSFAYPEVRRHKIEILCEIAGYGMDGILIDVLRHPPLVNYDAPVVDAYIKETGKDPRLMPGDGDEDWLRFRADRTFTLFLREVRAALDKAVGRRLPLYVRTVDQPWYNLLIGCDVDAWVRENIVDGIIFGPWCADATNYPAELDLRSYVRTAAGRVKIFGQVWRYGSVPHARTMAADFYRQGVDGVALYESNATVAKPSLRSELWRYNRPELLSAGG